MSTMVPLVIVAAVLAGLLSVIAVWWRRGRRCNRMAADGRGRCNLPRGHHPDAECGPERTYVVRSWPRRPHRGRHPYDTWD